MNRETFQVEFVTPCFLAGAEGQAEWRAASIRGQFRWWFRAVAGAHWRGDLPRVLRWEERIFGSTERKSLLQVRTFPGPTTSTRALGTTRDAATLARHWGDESPDTLRRLTIMKEGREVKSNPVQYLGFGPISMNGIRPYFPAGSTATFEFRLGRDTIENDAHEVFDTALWAWLNLGGIGSKSRKGFGSLQCHAPASISQKTGTRGAFQSRASALLAEAGKFPGTPLWTHFSSRSRIYIATQEAKSWEEAMEWLGAWLIGFRRRYGFPGDTRALAGQAIANRDYEWAAPKGKVPRKEVPDRAGFGLPLPFRRNVAGRSQGETVIWGASAQEGEDQDARRASPLLLHVSKFGSGFAPVLTYLPAELLPSGGKLKFKDHPRDSYPISPQQLEIIDHFLSHLVAKKRIEEVAS